MYFGSFAIPGLTRIIPSTRIILSPVCTSRFFQASFAIAAVTISIPAAAGEQTALPTITVYSSRFAEKLEDALPQTRVIGREEISNSGLTDVSQILQKLGNIPTRINLNGMQDLSLDLRGYGANSDNNVVILLDGMRLSEIEQAAARISMVPVEMIDHIEITRGASGVLYGEGTTSGIINIVTRHDPGEVAIVSGKIGSYQAKEGNLFGSKQSGNAAFSVYGKSLDTDNYRQNNLARVRSGGGMAIWQPNADSSVGVRLYADEQSTRLPGPLSLSQAIAIPTLSVNPDDYGVTRGDSLTLFGTSTYKSADIGIDLSVRDKSANSTYVSLGGNSNSSASMVNLSPRAKFRDAFAKGNDLTVGLDLSKWNRTYSSIYPAFPAFSTVNERLSQSSAAAYIRDDWMINPVDRVTIGGRTEQIKKDFTNFSSYNNPNSSHSLTATEFQYTRTFPKEIQAYGRIGSSYRIPNIDDLRGAASSLSPQTARDYEIGLSIRKMSSSNFVVRIFKSDIRKEIFYDPVLAFNVNLPATRRKGFEMEGRYQVAHSIAVRGAWQKMSAVFVEGDYQGARVPLVPNFNLQTGIEWKSDDRQTLDLSARFVGRQYLDSDFANSLAPIPPFWTADLRYSSNLTKQLSFIFSSNNLLNKKYFDYANSSSGYYPSPGLNFSAMVKYRF